MSKNIPQVKTQFFMCTTQHSLKTTLIHYYTFKEGDGEGKWKHGLQHDPLGCVLHADNSIYESKILTVAC